MMKLVRDVIEEKSLRKLITVGPKAPVVEAAKLMTLWNVGTLLVFEAGQLIGLFSERALVRAIATGETLAQLRVQDLMTREVRLVPPDLTTDECMMLMTQLRLRHVEVSDGEHLLGIISVGDLVKDVVNEQAFVIEQLERYIRRAANA